MRELIKDDKMCMFYEFVIHAAAPPDVKAVLGQGRMSSRCGLSHSATKTSRNAACQGRVDGEGRLIVHFCRFCPMGGGRSCGRRCLAESDVPWTWQRARRLGIANPGHGCWCSAPAKIRELALGEVRFLSELASSSCVCFQGVIRTRSTSPILALVAARSRWSGGGS